MPERFTVLAQSSPTGIYLIQDDRLRYANPAMAQMFGYEVDELVGRMHPLDIVHPDDRPMVAENIRQRIEGEVEDIRYRFRGLRKDGTAFPAEAHGRRIQHEGRVGVIGTLLDGTERQRAEDALRTANARLEEAQRIAHVGWWERDYATARVTLSDEACRIFGVQAVDLPDWHGRWLELIHPEDRARAAEASAAALRGGPRYDLEYRVVRPDGTIRVVHSKGDVTWDASGQPLRQFGVMQDVTELRQAERELRASEARFRTFVDQATDGFFLHDSRGTILDVNRQACASLGYSRDELIGMHPRDFDVGLDEASFQSLRRRVLAGEPLSFETRHRHKGGTVFPVEIRAGRFEHEGDHRHLSLVRDITERKRAEQALRDSEERFRTLVQFSFDLHWESDAQHRFTVLQVSESTQGTWTPNIALGRTRWDIPYLEPDEVAWRRHRDTLDAHLPFRDFEYARSVPDGLVRHVSTSGMPVFDETGRFVGYRGVGRDITQRKRAEQALRDSEERFRTLVQFSFDVVRESDAQHRFTHQEYSEGLAHALAPGSEIGKARWEIPYLEPDEEAWRRHRATLDAHLPFRDFELARPNRDGGRRYVSVSGLPIFDQAGRFVGYRGVGRDITERKRSETALREMQAALAHAGRVSTMGQLTASIAHEVRQPVAAVVTNAQAALRWLDRTSPDLEEVRQALARIARDAGRAGDVIARVRALVEKSAPRRDQVAVNQVVLDVLGLVQPELARHDVLLRTELAEALPPVPGDKVQLQQVVLNLVVNAIEAMDGAAVASPRTLVVATEATLSGSVAVAVRDTGPGLGSSDPERMFEAFHSTKPNGLGMGLAICRSIIEAHGGRLWAAANEPCGAVFQFMLPAEPDQILPAETCAGHAPAA